LADGGGGKKIRKKDKRIKMGALSIAQGIANIIFQE
jgi:hypothetical protein